MYDYFHNLFLAVDQLINTIIGGDPDETFSSRVGKCQRGDHGLLIRVLAWPLARPARVRPSVFVTIRRAAAQPGCCTMSQA
jgi:hypothetical protein